MVMSMSCSDRGTQDLTQKFMRLLYLPHCFGLWQTNVLNKIVMDQVIPRYANGFARWFQHYRQVSSDISWLRYLYHDPMLLSVHYLRMCKDTNKIDWRQAAIWDEYWLRHYAKTRWKSIYQSTFLVIFYTLYTTFVYVFHPDFITVKEKLCSVIFVMLIFLLWSRMPSYIVETILQGYHYSRADMALIWLLSKGITDKRLMLLGQRGQWCVKQLMSGCAVRDIYQCYAGAGKSRPNHILSNLRQRWLKSFKYTLSVSNGLLSLLTVTAMLYHVMACYYHVWHSVVLLV